MLTRYLVDVIIRTESVEKARKLSVQDDLHMCESKRDVKMENKNVKVLEAAKYLIQLYISTKYRCNRQKLQKLLLFAHFAMLIDGKEGLLGSEQITASNIGLGVETVSREYYAFEFNGIDESIEISNVVKKENSEFNFDYQYDEEVLKDITVYLRAMFLKFGAYHSDILSKATTKLKLYPMDVDFMKQPAGIYKISVEKTNEYIEDIKYTAQNNICDNTVTLTGCDIIIKEISAAINKVVQRNSK